MDSFAVEGESPLIRNFIRGNSSARFSSKNLHWPALDLERHVISPTEVPEGTIDCALLLMWRGNSVARGEHLDSGGSYISYAKRPGTLTLFTPGAIPQVRTSTKSDFLVCAFNKEFFSNMREEIRDERKMPGTNRGTSIASDEPSFHDVSLARLLLLLEDEVKCGGVSGALYAEYLAHVLAMRLCTIRNSGANETRRKDVDELPSKVLNQLIDKIEANPVEPFELASLAANCGYSYGRFLRAFRAKTGFSPHRYITRLRLNRAKQLMRKHSLTLLEIALETGFASHAHFTHAFRQHFGCAPSDFRHSLKK
jgi:AraC family transcriptional regulator